KLDHYDAMVARYPRGTVPNRQNSFQGRRMRCLNTALVLASAFLLAGCIIEEPPHHRHPPPPPPPPPLEYGRPPPPGY
ncbi:MAG TPA: hypothetical protein VFG12_07600, partial [Rhodopila sp.]|nr:hypothetical protein [Rhodopila sp.]